MAKTYKAGVYKDLEKKIVAVEDWEMPEIGPKDVLYKPVRSSICGSDTSGVGPGPNREFGHESAGYIVEIGSEVTDFKVGERVWPHPTYIMTGRYSCMFPGFSEYVLIKEPVRGDHLWPIPDNVSYDLASIIEPMGVGTRGKNRPGPKPGDHVVVYGAGSIGLFAMTSLVCQGITPVVVDIALSSYKRQILDEMGVIIAPLPEEGDKFEFFKELWGELPGRQSGTAIDVDIVIDCAGAPNIIDDFFKLRKEHSRLVSVGISYKPQEITLPYLMSNELVIMGSSGYNREDIEEVFDILAGEKAPWLEKIITHHFKQADLQEALNKAMDRSEAIKVIIDME